MPLKMPEPDAAVLGRRVQIVAALREIVPGEGVIEAEDELRAYESDGLTAYRQPPMVAVLPQTVEQVSRVLRWCRAARVKVVPRGSGTSLSGGALPLADAVLLCMAKFNRLLEINYADRLAVVQPGVTNLAITRAVEDAGFYYAPDRAGYDVVFVEGEACCGALVRHLGREEASLEAARRNVDAWTREIEGIGLDAIVITASGCGTTLKDYAFMLRADSRYAARAARVSALAKDVTELLCEVELPKGDGRGLAVAYHAACSLQHGQKITDAPKDLLCSAGFSVRTPKEAHLCCGSAGTHNILQPEIASRLRERKVTNIEMLGAQVIATANVGCMVQIGQATKLPVVHTVELIDWATGGPVPEALSHLEWSPGT